jgi:hypothetical protein
MSNIVIFFPQNMFYFVGFDMTLTVKLERNNRTFEHFSGNLQGKGLFGWAVAVKKAAVGYELWKKLLWVVSC